MRESVFDSTVVVIDPQSYAPPQHEISALALRDLPRSGTEHAYRLISPSLCAEFGNVATTTNGEAFISSAGDMCASALGVMERALQRPFSMRECRTLGAVLGPDLCAEIVVSSPILSAGELARVQGDLALFLADGAPRRGTFVIEIESTVEAVPTPVLDPSACLCVARPEIRKLLLMQAVRAFAEALPGRTRIIHVCVRNASATTPLEPSLTALDGKRLFGALPCAQYSLAVESGPLGSDYCILLPRHNTQVSGDYLLRADPSPGREEMRLVPLSEEGGEDETICMIGVIGKHVDRPNGYLSVCSAVMAAARYLSSGQKAFPRVEIRLIAPESLLSAVGTHPLAGVHAIVITGGMNDCEPEGIVAGIEYARVNRVPTLGVCLGMQLMVCEFARHRLGLEDAMSTELAPACRDPVVDSSANLCAAGILHADRVEFSSSQKGLRAGTFCSLCTDADSLVAACCRSVFPEVPLHAFSRRFWHGYTVNPRYFDRLRDAGMRITAMDPSHSLALAIELPTGTHPFYLGVQYHPECQSSNAHPCPEFIGLLRAAAAHLRA